jgi:tetratricopeptide (TPR) repeat protein
VLLARELVLGEDNPNTLATKHNLGDTYRALGDYEKAISLYTEVLEAEVKVLGPTHPSTATTAFNLGFTHYQNNNLALAIFYVKASIKATHITRIKISSLDESIKQSFLETVENRYHFLGKLLEEAGRSDEAQEVILLLKMNELMAPLSRTEEANITDDDLSNYTSENLFKNSQEGPALDQFFNISSSLAALGLERANLIKRMANGETLSPEENLRLDELDTQITASNKVFNDFCNYELPKILKETESSKSEKIQNLRSLQDTLRALGAGTVLIHTLATDDVLYLFLTTPDTLIIKKTNISRTDLQEKVQGFYILLNDPSLDPREIAK